VNKRKKRLIRAGGTSSFTDFAARLSAKWRLGTTPTVHQADTDESTENILRDLVAIPTVSGNYEANHEALDYIEQFVTKYGLHVRRYEWNGFESLVATTKGTKKPTVMLTSHVDVVPAPQHLFQLRTENGNYYGRGVLDMKCGVAASLGALRELGKAATDYDFGIMITTDEEVGGFDGAAQLAKEGYIPQIIVLPDGGMDWNMERACKGIWHVTFKANGKSAHGSRPWEGSNAISTLTAALTEIAALFTTQNTAETSTMNVGTIQGGTAINLIPNTATASIDFRFIDKNAMDTLRASIQKIAKKHTLEIVTEVESDPVANDVNHPLMQAYAACTEKVIGHPIKWVLSNAGNDGRFFASLGSHLAVAYPPGGNHHGADEYITTESLTQMQQIFVAYIKRVAHTA
jgi:acetylornithine deacetylase/succinyl-diaminopimelate desuccinylase-like protein